MSASAPAFVLPLAVLRRTDVARAGGKAASLGEMLHAGLPVPEGFCVTCDAYRAHLRAHGLDGRIAARLSVGFASPEALDAVAAEIREWIATAEVPAAVVAPILAAYCALGARARVAVRSSGTAEDLADASFAGQHETYLDVAGDKAVLDRVRACWASLWTDRAVAYRARQGVDHRDVAIACVVQQMVPADSAGVAFTADPLTGVRDRVVVNAVAGLGEALVSGHATADQFVVRKSDGAVLEARCATGGPPSGVEPFLAQIASLAVGAERHAGVPQDIEWAVSATSLYLLQARPITRLPAEPVSFEDAMRPLYGHTVRLRELVPTAMTPLGADVTVRAFALMGEGMVTQGLVSPRFADRFAALARAFQGRVYNDMTLLRDGMAPLADEVAVLDFVEGGPWPRPRRDRWRAIGLEIPRLARLPRILSYLRHFDRHAADAIAGFEQSIAPLEREPLHTWSRERLLDLLRGEPSPAYRRAFAGVLCANGLAGTDAEIAFTTASRMVTAWAGEPATTTAKLACGLPGIGDVECVATLWALARTARGIPELRRALQADPGSALGAAADQPAWREAFEAFLVRYGHRGIEELDVARPRWRDQPAFVLSVIANYVENGDETANPEGVHRRLAAEREAIEQRISRRLGRSPLRRWLVREVIAMLQKLTVVRQNTKSAYIRGFDLSRRAALELGRRLVEQDRLDRVEDCFFLELADLEQPRDFRGLVAERRRTHAAWQREVPPRFVDARGRPVHVAAARTVTDAATGADTLTGIGSSPGIARGPVRIVRDPSAGVRLAPGHVLVAPYTDPAWTPLFASVAAVVVEVGSVLSHASIVARELGIPSVVAVAAATAKLRDGDIVEVDGHAGTVRSAGR